MVGFPGFGPSTTVATQLRTEHWVAMVNRPPKSPSRCRLAALVPAFWDAKVVIWYGPSQGLGAALAVGGETTRAVSTATATGTVISAVRSPRPVICRG